jgi:hypothetical protein
MATNKRLAMAISVMNLATEKAAKNRHWTEKRKDATRKAAAKHRKTSGGAARLFVRSIFQIYRDNPQALRMINIKKIFGYELSELVKHIESQFTKQMTWDNYGVNSWHIDHIRPVSLFEIIEIGDKEFKKCWALDNLRPILANENLKKGNKYEPITMDGNRELSSRRRIAADTNRQAGIEDEACSKYRLRQ